MFKLKQFLCYTLTLCFFSTDVSYSQTNYKERSGSYAFNIVEENHLREAVNWLGKGLTVYGVCEGLQENRWGNAIAKVLLYSCGSNALCHALHAILHTNKSSYDISLYASTGDEYKELRKRVKSLSWLSSGEKDNILSIIKQAESKYLENDTPREITVSISKNR